MERFVVVLLKSSRFEITRTQQTALAWLLQNKKNQKLSPVEKGE